MSKFLMSEAAEEAVRRALPSITNMMEEHKVDGSDLYIVVLDPDVTPTSFDGVIIRDAYLYEEIIGDGGLNYQQYAHDKARETWRTGLPSRVVQTRPHLLSIDDTVYGGSAIYEGIIVACSGVEEHYDETFALTIAAQCWGLSMDAYKKWRVENPNASNLR